tara:strand:- start:438 stop:866 length:429 start_codon:yes stop_codon:yes gene_type:complete
MNILFLCIGNSARSQIAEGLAIEMLPTTFDIRSAGSNPEKNVHKDAISVMIDVGIDISNKKPKSIDSIDKEFMSNLDYVITLCAEEVCPVVPITSKVFHWPNEDPDNVALNDIQSKNAFIKTRENIFNLLKKFLITEDIKNL